MLGDTLWICSRHHIAFFSLVLSVPVISSLSLSLSPSLALFLFVSLPLIFSLSLSLLYLSLSLSLSLSIYLYTYISIYIYQVHTISFHTFFVWAFKITVDTYEFNTLLLYILWNDWPFFMVLGINEQLQQQLEYTVLKPDCHSCWISKMQSSTLEERYAIKFCFKLGKNEATETYRMLQTAFRPSCMNRASVSEWNKKFKKARSLWGMMRCVGGIRKSIDQSWLVRVTMLRFMKRFRRKRPALFKSGQWHFHQDNTPDNPCHR